MPVTYSLIPTITFSFRDEKGAVAHWTCYVERLSAADITAGRTYESIADNIMQDIFPLTTGLIVNAYVKVPVTIDTGVVNQDSPQRPLIGSDVEEGAAFTFVTENGFKTMFRIPTFAENRFVAGTQRVDLEDDQQVKDFVNTIINGGDSLAGAPEDRKNFTDSRGDDIIACTRAEDAFQKSRKKLKNILYYTP